MKLATIVFLLAISGVTDARLHSPDHRQLGKSKKNSKVNENDNRADTGTAATVGGNKNKKAGGSGGNTAQQRVADAYAAHLASIGKTPPTSGTVSPVPVVPVEDVNRADVDDPCCDEAAHPQPASQFDEIGNRVGGCDLAEGESYKPTYYVQKKSSFKLNEYITNVPRDHECMCNDQCANQDGTSMICCLQSHYFSAADGLPIKLCVDISGVTEAVESGCIIDPADDQGLMGDPLDVAFALPVEPNK